MDVKFLLRSPHLLCLIIVLAVVLTSHAAPVKPDQIMLEDHKGQVLTGNLTVNLVYYGRFTSSQRAIVADFVKSLTPPLLSAAGPSVSLWWSTTVNYRGGGARLQLGKEIIDESMSLGRGPLSLENVKSLAQTVGHHRGAITAVLTAADVLVTPFCAERCGVHDHIAVGKHGKTRYPYLWVGNPATQCPAQCAWPFHQPTNGPKNPPLVPPNGDVGVDGIVINLASLLAGAATNPYGDGYYQGAANAGLEAATVCAGTFGSGAYPGYPGTLLTDSRTGASYNAIGIGGRKYLLPALWDVSTSQCQVFV